MYICILTYAFTYASYVCFLHMLLTYASYVCFSPPIPPLPTSSPLGKKNDKKTLMGHTIC